MNEVVNQTCPHFICFMTFWELKANSTFSPIGSYLVSVGQYVELLGKKLLGLVVMQCGGFGYQRKNIPSKKIIADLPTAFPFPVLWDIIAYKRRGNISGSKSFAFYLSPAFLLHSYLHLCQHLIII